MSKLIIAIDGPVGSGKSTVARRVAELLGYTHLDSGAMYRGVAWKALRDGVPLDSPAELAALAESVRIDLVPRDGNLRVILDGQDITELIRTPEVSHAASVVAAIPGVRHPMVAEQRRAGAQGGIVMEGRDIGSVVFPHADLKIFLEASPEVRAERRLLELQEKGEPPARSPGPRARDVAAGTRGGRCGCRQYRDGCGRDCAGDRHVRGGKRGDS